MSRQNESICHWKSSRRLPLGIALYVFASALGGTACAETWTNLRGTHSVEADMIGLWDDNVVLRLRDGRRVTVKLNDLRSESRILAQELATGLDSSRLGRIEELKGQAAAAAAPAPDPLPEPAPAGPYTAPVKDAKANEFLKQLDESIRQGHLLAVFDSLPPSYRSDISDLVKASAAKMNPETWQSLVGTAQQLGDLIVTRQKWFLSSPRIQALPAEQLSLVESQVLTFAGLLRAGLQPDALQLEKLKTVELRQWLAERDQAMAPYVAALFKQSSSSTSRVITVDSEKDSTAVISIDNAGVTSKVTFTRVEGYWVPKTVADQWSESVEAWKSELTEGSGESFLDTYAAMVQPLSPMLLPMAQATDAGQFHQAMEELIAPAETLASGIATMLGRSMSLASQGGPDGYGEYGEYGEYDDMEGSDMEDEYEQQMMEMERQQEEAAMRAAQGGR